MGSLLLYSTDFLPLHALLLDLDTASAVTLDELQLQRMGGLPQYCE